MANVKAQNVKVKCQFKKVNNLTVSWFYAKHKT